MGETGVSRPALAMNLKDSYAIFYNTKQPKINHGKTKHGLQDNHPKVYQGACHQKY